MLLLFALLFCDVRTWHSNGYQCRATFVSYDNGQVELVREDNSKLVQIDKSILSKTDQDYVETIRQMTNERRWVIQRRSIRATYVGFWEDPFVLRTFIVLQTNKGRISIAFDHLSPRDRKLVTNYEQGRQGLYAQRHIDWAKGK